MPKKCCGQEMIIMYDHGAKYFYCLLCGSTKPIEEKKPMKQVLEDNGWKHYLEGWKDPVKGDKVSLRAAWNRYEKRSQEKQNK